MKVKSQKSKVKSQGVSLLEILVVISIFSVLAILATRAVLLTLRGSRKSEALGRVRENVDYSLAVIERNLRNAESIVDVCPNSDTSKINFLNSDGIAASFSCDTSGVGFVASSSARLTNEKVDVTSCSFVCEAGNGSPPSVTIIIEAKDANVTGIEAAQVTASTKIFLRTY